MTRFDVRVSAAAILVLLLLVHGSLNAAVEQPQQAQQSVTTVRAPRDAHAKQNRTDLENLFKQQPEIRIIIGLQTPQERTRSIANQSDQARERSVASRQAVVLGRAQGLNIRDIKRFRFHPFIAMTVDATALGALLADSDVTSVSEDGIIFPMLVDTVALTRASSAWSEGFRGNGQTVAVLDTGVDSSHPFFSGKVVAEACFSNPVAGATTLCPDGQPQQIGAGAGIHCPDIAIGCWHGSHVAGIAVGNVGHLSASAGGMAPGANVMPVQVFQRECYSGACQLAAYYSDIMQGLEYVYSLRNNYAIAAANLSLGGIAFTASCDNEAPGVTSVIQSLRASNIPTIVSSGNSGLGNALSFPACITQAISVGATTKQNGIASFSNSSSALTLLAPGNSIQSSIPGGGYGYTSGTSMAAPHVTGAWATLKSAKPSATVAEVLNALNAAGLPITDSRNGITKPLVQIGDSVTQLGAVGVLLGRSAPSGSEIMLDNADAGVMDQAGGRTFTGMWCTASPWNQYGIDALINCAGTEVSTYRWTPTLPTAGSWDVYIWWSAQSNQSANAAVKVVSADGQVTKTYDQRSGGGQWVLHGRYSFTAGANGYVEVGNGGEGRVSADAVRFVPMGGPAPLPTVTISATDILGKEAGLDPASFTVSRTGSTTSDLTVQYKINGTAGPNIDYVALSGNVTIPAGASTALIVVTPIDDTLLESNETIVVTILAAAGYALGAPSAATVKIASDDSTSAPTSGPSELVAQQVDQSLVGLGQFERPEFSASDPSHLLPLLRRRLA